MANMVIECLKKENHLNCVLNAMDSQYCIQIPKQKILGLLYYHSSVL